MLIFFLELILAVIIGFFTLILGTLGWAFPSTIGQAYLVFFQTLHTFSTFLPFIGDIVAIGLIIIPAFIVRYVFDVALWLWSLVPWIGTRTTIPTGASTSTSTTRSWGDKTWESKTTINNPNKKYGNNRNRS